LPFEDGVNLLFPQETPAVAHKLLEIWAIT
jgi:hypothetical protein